MIFWLKYGVERQPLFGVQSAEAPNSQLTEDELGYDPELEQSLLEDEATTQDLAEASLFNDDDGENAPVTGGTINRKRALNTVPALIDNKRKHMERQLSAGQRDKILLQESKDEKEFCSELSKSLKESNPLFAESIRAMSGSMAALASSIQKSFELSARQHPNYIYQPPLPANQNFFNQQNVYGEVNDQNQQPQSYFKLQ